MSRFTVDDDLLPTAIVAVRLNDAHGGGWLVGRLNLEELWRMVDRIRVGDAGLRAGRHRRRPAARARRPRCEVARRTRRQHAGHPLVLAASRVPIPECQQSRRSSTDGRARRGCSASAHGCPPRLDGDRRAAGRRGVRHSHRAAAAARRSPSPLALLAMLAVGYFWGRSFIDPILRADARHQGARRGPSRRARRSSIERRARPARHRLQQHGRPAGRAAGGRPQEGTPGDVRPHRRRPRPRPLAPDSEHRQQLQADREDVRRPRVPRELQAHRRARAGAGQARARRPAQHRPADAARALPASTSTRRSPSWSESMQTTARERGPDARDRAGVRAALHRRATCSRSTASTAT